MKKPRPRLTTKRIKEIYALEDKLKSLRNELKDDASSRVMEMPKKIREIRKSRGMTQEKLAEYLFLSRGQVVNVELGNSSTSIPILLQICAVLQVTPNDLFGY